MELTIENASLKLSEIRQEKGLTLMEVSKRTGIAKSTLIAIESGRVKPQAVTIFRMRKYFNSLEINE